MSSASKGTCSARAPQGRRALALYQLGSATADWVMWIALADQNVFSTTLGRVLVMISIPTHYTLGLLLVRAIRREPAQPPGAAPPGAFPPAVANTHS
jgi:hypothetical protein